MKFTCNGCGAQYMISDDKVGPSGVKVRCKKCGNVVLVRRASEEAAAPAAAPGANGAAAPAGGLDAELGQAFDNAFGDPPAAAEGAQDLGATQAMAPEDAVKVAAAAASPAPTEWYVAIGQAQVGPLPLAEVKRKWEAGDVGPDSLVWRPGMGDWQPLSAVPELAGYLAPVARPSPAPAARAETPAPRAQAAQAAEKAPTPAPTPAAGGDVSWKPVGASALAALASEELAARSAPAERRPTASGPAAPSGVKSLVEGLPDGGGVDPTGAIPLPIKGLETTGEKKLERRSSVATRAEEARHKRSMTRVIAVAAAIVVVAVVGAAAFVLTQRKAEPAPVVVATAVPAPAAPAAPAPAAPAPAPAAPPTAVAATPAPPAAAPAPPPPPEPPVAKAEPEPPARAKPGPAPKGKHAKVAKAEPPPPRSAAVARAPAQAAPAAPAPARKKDSLLDFDSNDSALDEALGGGGAKRSVYVPPAPGGGGGLPDKLSPAQINEAVAGRIDSLRRCVSEQKSRDPQASGVLKLKWVISSDGSVRDVKSLPGDYASGSFSSCITGVVRGIRFPRSATAGQEVTFPFSF